MPPKVALKKRGPGRRRLPIPGIHDQLLTEQVAVIRSEERRSFLADGSIFEGQKPVDGARTLTHALQDQALPICGVFQHWPKGDLTAELGAPMLCDRRDAVLR